MDTFKLSIALGIICAISATVLAVANNLTKKEILKRETAFKKESLEKVLPPFDNNPIKEEQVISYYLEDSKPIPIDTKDISSSKINAIQVSLYPAVKENQVVGVAAEGKTSMGYGGDIKVLVGFTPNSHIQTVLVTDHKETPGLGTNVTDRKEVKTLSSLFEKKNSGPSLPPSKYLDQFSGEKVAKGKFFSLKQEGGIIDAVSGATVSSRALIDGVNKVSQAYTLYLENQANKVESK